MSKYEVIKKYIDEFDSYSRKFAESITENDSVEDIVTLIAGTMDKVFGEEIVPEKFFETAQKIRIALY